MFESNLNLSLISYHQVDTMTKEKRKWNGFKGLFSKKPEIEPHSQSQSEPPPIADAPSVKSRARSRTRPKEIFVLETADEGEEVYEVDYGSSEESKEVFVIEPAQGETFIIEPTEEDAIEYESVSNDMFVVEPTKEYKILGLEADATDDELKKRYRDLLKKYHPDMGGDPKEFMKMRKAYLKIKESRVDD